MMMMMMMIIIIIIIIIYSKSKITDPIVTIVSKIGVTLKKYKLNQKYIETREKET